MTKSGKYGDWTIRDLSNAIHSDERVIAKEGQGTSTVNHVELSEMKNERTARLFSR
jgi:hypothetical protein